MVTILISNNQSHSESLLTTAAILVAAILVRKLIDFEHLYHT